MSEEHKRKIGLSNSISLKGHPNTENQLNALKKGRVFAYTPESILKRANKKKGTFHTEETKLKIKEKLKKVFPNKRPINSGCFTSANSTGELSYNWKGGISKINKSERQNLMLQNEYKFWRKAVFNRDNYTCIKCGLRGINLNAHHIKTWTKYPELRYNINNGISLCKDCHIKEHKNKPRGE